MTSNDIIQWIRHPEMLNTATLYELRTMVARYPAFQSLRLLYLKNLYLLHDENFGHELRKSVLYVPDRRVLFYFIEGEISLMKPARDAKPVVELTKEEPSVDRTLTLINSFLLERPDDQPLESEQVLGSNNSVYVLTEDNINDDVEDENESEELDDGYFTETLAKIYLKQHRYSKALEIIRKLYLKYPKKNIYFADQIRFLEKIVINEKTKS
ncbi:MAG: tetratricopeptide repeat protein [Bacteroidales bacterium]|nr:tetratricopeptide repeat protein [Bacteroidales bacterium]